MTRSTKPRKPTTTAAVATSDKITLRWSLCRKKKYAAGLVSTATAVATRASRRSCDASATDSSLERRVPATSAVAIDLPV